MNNCFAIDQSAAEGRPIALPLEREVIRHVYPIISIILAGGKGTRMHSADRHKVCFEIDGRPAINRAIDVYKQCGIERHVVVVGALAGQVIETVGKAHEAVATGDSWARTDSG